jgi:ubiquinone/menaquinone biosynthesis C-methylase UbiE
MTGPLRGTRHTGGRGSAAGRDPRSGPAAEPRSGPVASAGLRHIISTPEGKQRYVRRLFATIADRYDFITTFLSYGQDRRWKRTLIRLAEIRPQDRVLDVACGTGDILFEALRFRPRRAIGLDLTLRMIQLARRRHSQLPTSFASPTLETSDLGFGNRSRPGRARPTFFVGDMLALPFQSADFDVVTTGYGLRNVPQLPMAIREIHRVLAPGGRVLSLDFNRPPNPVVRGAYLAYLTVVGSLLGLVLHGDPDTYRYIPESIRNYPGAGGVARMMEAEGFVEVRVVPILFGLMAIHVGQKPVAPKC